VAARRLLIILMLLLAASVAAAALAPDRTSRIRPVETSTTSTTSTATTAPEPTGEALNDRINASRKDPETVEAFVGDQLELDVGVTAEPGLSISLEDFGVTDFAAPEAPAHFNLLLREPGYFAITDEGGRVVGRLEVKVPGTAPEPGAGAGDRPAGDTTDT
jgi:hypothetical protein